MSALPCLDIIFDVLRVDCLITCVDVLIYECVMTRCIVLTHRIPFPDGFRLQNSHGWVVPYEEEDGAAHFAGAENVHIFAYGQCVLVPHTALRPISIRAYSISLKDLTLSYRSRSASTPTPPLCISFASTPEERDMVQIVALESFRLAAMEDTGMDAMQAAHHTVRLRETLRSLNAVSYTHLTLPTICSV